MNVSPDILSLTNEAAVLAKKGKIVYANAAARAILGHDCEGKAMHTLFGEDISSSQALNYSAATDVRGKQYLVRSSAVGELQAIFLTVPETSPLLMTDSLLCSLRSSLMTINLSAEALRDCAGDAVSEQFRSKIASLAEGSRRISRLINNASIARCMADGAIPFSPALNDLAEVCMSISEAVAVLRPDIRVEYRGPEIQSASFDKSLVETLLLNLISNALTHAEGMSSITIGLSASGGMAHLSVANDGRGIEQDELNTVFSRYRYLFSLADLGRGAGLGMTVVRGIAARHGGTMLLESKVDSGTRVRVSINCRAAAKLGAGESRYVPAGDGMDTVLTGLAGCIPAERFTEKYLD